MHNKKTSMIYILYNLIEHSVVILNIAYSEKTIISIELLQSYFTIN